MIARQDLGIRDEMCLPPNESETHSVISDIKEGAFSVISDELKIKMKVLGITNEDISGVLQSEDDIGLYLEIIDLYFDELKKMYQATLDRIRTEYGRIEVSEEATLKDVKNNFLTRLTWHKELKVLFAKFPGIGHKIGQMERGFTDLTGLAWYLRNNKYFQFSPDIYFRFAGINPGRSNDEYGNNKDPIDQITDVYKIRVNRKKCRLLIYIFLLLRAKTIG